MNVMPNAGIKRFEAHMQFEKAASDYDSRIIAGVASTSDVDRQGQIVNQESLAKAIEQFMDTNRSLFFMHDWNAPIGEVLEMRPTKTKLWAKAKINSGYEIPLRGTFGGVTMTTVDNIWEWIVQGAVRTFSIGFLGDEEIDPKGKKPPMLNISDLLELSVVTIPANRRAQFNIAKAMMNPYGNDLEMPWSNTLVETIANTNKAITIPEGLDREDLYEIQLLNDKDDEEITEDDILKALDAFTLGDDENIIKIERAIDQWKI